ncbi:MAG: PLP-dependent aminotransferase family protein [Acidobacteriota bacterium]
MLIVIDRGSAVPIYQQVFSGIRGLISQGVLKPGEQIPSTRELSSKLGVSRRTIDQAFALLQSDGVIESHVGQGSFVSRAAQRAAGATSKNFERDESGVEPDFWESILPDESERASVEHMVIAAGNSVPYSFVAAMPDPKLFPVQRFRRCVDTVLKRSGRSLTELGDTYGYYPLREYLAKRLQRDSIQVAPDEILITSGCQQSLNLISLLLVSANDSVVIENPTYPGALRALTLRAGRSHGIQTPITEQSLALLPEILERERPKLIYAVSNYQNPTGGLMGINERKQLVNMALQYKIPIIEDDVFGELHFEGTRLPNLKAFDKKGSVILINSFSKSLNTGIRIGWIAASRKVIEQLSYFKEVVDLQTNGIVQAALYTFCRRGILDRHLKRVRRIFMGRRDALMESLTRYFPRDCFWSHPKGGLSIWVTLPPDLDSRKLFWLAQAKGVAFFPGEFFYFGSRTRRNTLRIGFGTLEPEKITEGIKILGSLLSRSESTISRAYSLNRRRYPIT